MFFKIFTSLMLSIGSASSACSPVPTPPLFEKKTTETQQTKVTTSLNFFMSHTKDLIENSIKNNTLPKTDEIQKLENFIQKKSFELFDGLLSNGMCHLMALDAIIYYQKFEKTHNNNDIPSFIEEMIPLIYGGKRIFTDFGVFKTGLEADMKPIKIILDSIKNGMPPKKKLSSKETLHAALRSISISQMYKRLGVIENPEKMPDFFCSKNFTTCDIISYPSWNFFQSYSFLLEEMSKRDIKACVLLMKFKSDKETTPRLTETTAYLEDVKIFYPYGSLKEKEPCIIFEMYMYNISDADIIKKITDSLKEKDSFNKNVLDIAANHPQYMGKPSSDLEKNLIPDNMTPYQKDAKQYNLGTDRLFNPKKTGKNSSSIELSNNSINLNIMHVYAAFEDERSKILVNRTQKTGNLLKRNEPI